MDFEEFESKKQKDFEKFMMRYKAQYRDFSKVGDSTYSNELTSIAYDAYLAGQQSKQAEIDICEKLRDSQFDKLWNLTQAIEVARNGADEDFDLFLNHLSNILKGE